MSTKGKCEEAIKDLKFKYPNFYQAAMITEREHSPRLIEKVVKWVPFVP